MKHKQNRLKQYRLRNRRVDYYPAPDVADIIAYRQANGPEKSFAGVIDELIRAGHKNVSGNGVRS